MDALGQTPGQRDLAAFRSHLRNLGESERYWRLNALEALWEGSQYDGRPSFWDATVPLRERAPVVQSQIVRAAGRRLASLLFGERTFPAVQVCASGYGVSLSDDDRAALGALISEIKDVASLRLRMDAMLEQGLKCGSAVAIGKLCEGVPCVDLKPAKWCVPTLGPRGEVRSMIVEYQMLDNHNPPRQMIYHREITSTEDSTYTPTENTGNFIKWTAVSIAETYPLEFCPVVWHRSQGDATSEGVDIDGNALFAGLEDEVEGLDFTYSQLYRTGQYNGEPQMFLSGIDPAQPVGATGRGAADDAKGDKFSWTASALPRWFGGSGRVDNGTAVKKAPGQIWRGPQGSDAKLIESTGAGAQIIKTSSDTLRRAILDAVGVILADPDALGKGELSARALMVLNAPMLALADNLRIEYGQTLCRVVDMVLRLLTTDAAVTGGVRLATYDKAAPILKRFYAVDTTGKRVWLGVPLELKWGSYFEPSSAEVLAAVQAASLATGGKAVMSQRRAVEMLAEVLGTEDVDAEFSAVVDADASGAAAVSSAIGALADVPAKPDAAPASQAQQPVGAALSKPAHPMSQTEAAAIGDGTMAFPGVAPRSPAMILPPHGVRDPNKVSRVAQSIQQGGWQGRPVLVERMQRGSTYPFRAWTGSHRIAAALAAGLPRIPAVEVDTEALIIAGYRRAAETLDDGTVVNTFRGGIAGNSNNSNATNNSGRKPTLLRALEAAGDLEGAAVMRAEIAANEVDPDAKAAFDPAAVNDS
jgi:hypothetical protein